MAQYICDVGDPEHKHTSREHTGNNNLNAERTTASLDSKHEANTLHELIMLRNTWYKTNHALRHMTECTWVKLYRYDFMPIYR